MRSRSMRWMADMESQRNTKPPQAAKRFDTLLLWSSNARVHGALDGWKIPRCAVEKLPQIAILENGTSEPWAATSWVTTMTKEGFCHWLPKTTFEIFRHGALAAHRSLPLWISSLHDWSQSRTLAWKCAMFPKHLLAISGKPLPFQNWIK